MFTRTAFVYQILWRLSVKLLTYGPNGYSEIFFGWPDPRETEMSSFFLHWSENGNCEISSVQNLDEILDQLTKESLVVNPYIVFGVYSNNDSLAIGLGLQEAVLTFTPNSEIKQNLVSQGNINASGNVVFYTHGHYSEFPRWQCIPIKIARDSFRHFYLTGTLSSDITWKES